MSPQPALSAERVWNIYRDAETARMSELRSCVKVEVTVLDSRQ